MRFHTANLLRLSIAGQLKDTLVIFTGEFGLTPFYQGQRARPQFIGDSMWMAGGSVYGATDDLGYYAVQDPCTTFDLWATDLHLLGLDHERLTFRFGGLDFRLTDVHGRVLKAVLA